MHKASQAIHHHLVLEGSVVLRLWHLQNSIRLCVAASEALSTYTWALSLAAAGSQEIWWQRARTPAAAAAAGQVEADCGCSRSGCSRSGCSRPKQWAVAVAVGLGLLRLPAPTFHSPSLSHRPQPSLTRPAHPGGPTMNTPRFLCSIGCRSLRSWMATSYGITAGAETGTGEVVWVVLLGCQSAQGLRGRV